MSTYAIYAEAVVLVQTFCTSADRINKEMKLPC